MTDLLDKARAFERLAQGELADVLRALVARCEAADAYARFGDEVFDQFWSQGEPGDIEGGDLQEIALKCGLLARTADVDAGATHSEWCEFNTDSGAEGCDCFAPTLPSYRALVAQQEGEG